MSYKDGEMFLLHAVGIDLTGDKSTPTVLAANKFVAPADCFIEQVKAMPTTAPTATEVVSVQVGTTADPNLYATLVLTDATINIAPTTAPTLTTDGDNNASTVRKRISEGDEIAVFAVNDGACVAGVVNVDVWCRALISE